MRRRVSRETGKRLNRPLRLVREPCRLRRRMTLPPEATAPFRHSPRDPGFATSVVSARRTSFGHETQAHVKWAMVWHLSPVPLARALEETGTAGWSAAPQFTRQGFGRGSGAGKTPGKSGHGDLTTKPIFSGETNSISTCLVTSQGCWGPGLALLAGRVVTVGKRVGDYPLSSAGPSADVGTGPSLISWDLSRRVVLTSKGTDLVGVPTWGHTASLSARINTSGFLLPPTLASQDQELSLPVKLSRSEQSRWKVTGINVLLSLLQPLGAQHSHRDAAAHVDTMSHLRKTPTSLQKPEGKAHTKATKLPNS